jgi:hypothetical protein
MEKIKGGEKLTSVFGCWPSFHDAEVHGFVLDRASAEGLYGPTVEATIHVYQMTNEVDAKGYYVLKNHVLVVFRFLEVAEIQLNGFNQQNVIWELEIMDISDRQLEMIKYEVEFAPSLGVSASLKCFDIEVVSVQACDPEGLPV